MKSDYEQRFYIFLIALGIFILGVQMGIAHGRVLQLDDIGVKYGINISN